MKTTINIGTNKGSVIGAVFYKPFKEITWDEIKERVEYQYPNQPIDIQGWALISEEPLAPIIPTLHKCDNLDDYCKVFNYYADKGYTFAANPEPMQKVNYIKQEGFFFTRISEQEYNQLNNGSDEDK